MPSFNQKRATRRRKYRKIQRKTFKGGAATRALIRAVGRNVHVPRAPEVVPMAPLPKAPLPKAPLPKAPLLRVPLPRTQIPMESLARPGVPPAQFRMGPEPTLFSGPRQNPLFGQSAISTARSSPFGQQQRLMSTSLKAPRNARFKIGDIERIKSGTGLKDLIQDPAVLKELEIEGRAPIPLVRWKVTKKLFNSGKLQGKQIENQMAVLEFEIAAKEAKENVSNLRQQLKALEEQNGGPRKSVPGLQQNVAAQAANAEALEQAAEGPGEVALGERAAAQPKPVELAEAVPKKKAAKGSDIAVAEGNQAINQVAKVLQENAQNAAKRANSALKKANEAQKLSNAAARAKLESEALKAKIQQMEAELKNPQRIAEIRSTSEAVESGISRVSAEGIAADAEGAIKLIQKEIVVVDNLIAVGNKDIQKASEALEPVLNQEIENVVAGQIKNEAANLGNAELNRKAPELFENFARKLLGKGDPVILERKALADAEAAFVGEKVPVVSIEDNAIHLMEVVKSWTPYGRALRRLKEMMKIGNKNMRGLKFQDPEIVHELGALKEFRTIVDEGLEIILERSNKADILRLIEVFTPNRLLNFKGAMIKVFASSVDVGTLVLNMMLTKIIPGKQFNAANVDNLIAIMRLNPQGAREALTKLIDQDMPRQLDLEVGFAMNFEKGKGLFGAKAMFSLLFAAGGAAVLFLACLNNIPDIKALGIAIQDVKHDNKLNFQEMQARAKLLRDAFVVDILRQVPPEGVVAPAAAASAAAVAVPAPAAVEPKVRSWTDYAMEQIGLNPEVSADRRRFNELADAAKGHAGDVAKTAAMAAAGVAAGAAARALFGK